MPILRNKLMPAPWASRRNGVTTDHALLLTSTGNGADPVVASANTLTDTTHGGAVVVDNANAGYQLGTAGTSATFSTAILQLPNGGIINDGGATLTGQIQIQNGAGTANTFIMGVGVDNPGTNTYYTGSNTVAEPDEQDQQRLPALGIVAIAPTGGSGAIYLQSTVGGSGHVISTPGVTTLANAVAETATAPISGVTADCRQCFHAGGCRGQQREQQRNDEHGRPAGCRRHRSR